MEINPTANAICNVPVGDPLGDLTTWATADRARRIAQLDLLYTARCSWVERTPKYATDLLAIPDLGRRSHHMDDRGLSGTSTL